MPIYVYRHRNLGIFLLVANGHHCSLPQNLCDAWATVMGNIWASKIPFKFLVKIHFIIWGPV